MTPGYKFFDGDAMRKSLYSSPMFEVSPYTKATIALSVIGVLIIIARGVGLI